MVKWWRNGGDFYKILHCVLFIICPIAIAYSMGQIIKSVCVCQSVCLSVCEHSHSRISWSIFTKIDTDVRTPKSKNEFVRGQYRTIPSPVLSPKTAILGQEVMKTHANIKYSYICLKCTWIAEIFTPYRKSGSRKTTFHRTYF